MDTLLDLSVTRYVWHLEKGEHSFVCLFLCASNISLSKTIMSFQRTRLLMNSWWGKEGKKVQPLSHLPKYATCSALWATVSHCSLQGSKKTLGGKPNTEPVCMSREGTSCTSHMPVFAFNIQIHTGLEIKHVQACVALQNRIRTGTIYVSCHAFSAVWQNN